MMSKMLSALLLLGISLTSEAVDVENQALKSDDECDANSDCGLQALQMRASQERPARMDIGDGAPWDEDPDSAPKDEDEDDDDEPVRKPVPTHHHHHHHHKTVTEAPEAETPAPEPVPEVTAATEAPEVEAATAAPEAETATEEPAVETVTGTPVAETATEAPEAETVTEAPEAETVTEAPEAETVTEAPAAETPATPEAETPAPKDCHTAVAGERCYKAVMWAMNKGKKMHPEWYPKSLKTFEDYQAHIKKYGKDNCPTPCPATAKSAAADSCASFGCGSHFHKERSCQCNSKCKNFGNCCADYTAVCH